MTEMDTHKQLHVAQIFIDMDHPEEALDILANPDEAMLENAWFWALRAAALFDLDRYKEAIDSTDRGLARAPEFTDLYLIRSRCQLQEQDLAAAEISILAALRHNPEEPRYLGHYARLLAVGKQFDKADRILAEAQRVSPDDPSIKYIRAEVAYLKGDSSAAARTMEEVLADNPDNPYAQSFLGSVEMEEGNVRRGIRGMRAGGQLDPGDKSLARSARTATIMASPLLWPLWPTVRFGPGVIWVGAMVLVFGLRMLGYERLSGYLAIIYLVWVVYTWTVPRAVKWWYERQYGTR